MKRTFSDADSDADSDSSDKVAKQAPAADATGKRKRKRVRKRKKTAAAAAAAGEQAATTATTSATASTTTTTATATTANKPPYCVWDPATVNVPDDTILTWTEDLIPKEVKKYWRHRHSLFTRFDEGVKLDHEGWYSVTPEKVAHHVATRCTGKVVVDAFCGAGGNSIQFALAGYKVISVDIDPVKLACAHHNAKLYGALENIDFVHGDFMKLAAKLKGDVVFLSPPWGGPEYLKHDTFDIKEMMPIDGEELFKEASKITKNIIYFMPKNSNSEQLINLAGPGSTCELEEVYLNDRPKVLCAYYGDLVTAKEK
ncbi:RNA cap guanine-N2 methyltransferase-domain-containing protein [Obelidium mucronatum]|nr:RNA cap guanine-N2 methyltransferase-domain-containing protein [Obelidium mucronatum]